MQSAKRYRTDRLPVECILLRGTELTSDWWDAVYWEHQAVASQAFSKGQTHAHTNTLTHKELPFKRPRQCIGCCFRVVTVVVVIVVLLFCSSDSGGGNCSTAVINKTHCL